VNEDLLQGFVLALVGMGVVFLALVLLGVLMALLSRPLPSLGRRPRQPQAVDGEVKGDGLEAEVRTLVVITAAVAAVMGPWARVRRIQMVQPALPSAWAAHGRAAVQASHRLRKASK
jgi:Na+-transporting methylmalonyl-CoA/oxaloacetate decarboxylase gamma subunit